MREDFQCCCSGGLWHKEPPQTNKNAGSFQGVYVSMFFLYSHGEIERKRVVRGCLWDVMAELPHQQSCKGVNLNLDSSVEVNGCC